MVLYMYVTNLMTEFRYSDFFVYIPRIFEGYYYKCKNYLNADVYIIIAKVHCVHLSPGSPCVN